MPPSIWEHRCWAVDDRRQDIWQRLPNDDCDKLDAGAEHGRHIDLFTPLGWARVHFPEGVAVSAVACENIAHETGQQSAGLFLHQFRRQAEEKSSSTSWLLRRSSDGRSENNSSSTHSDNTETVDDNSRKEEASRRSSVYTFPYNTTVDGADDVSQYSSSSLDNSLSSSSLSLFPKAILIDYLTIIRHSMGKVTDGVEAMYSVLGILDNPPWNEFQLKMLVFLPEWLYVAAKNGSAVWPLADLYPADSLERHLTLISNLVDRQGTVIGKPAENVDVVAQRSHTIDDQCYMLRIAKSHNAVIVSSPDFGYSLAVNSPQGHGKTIQSRLIAFEITDGNIVVSPPPYLFTSNNNGSTSSGVIVVD